MHALVQLDGDGSSAVTLDEEVPVDVFEEVVDMLHPAFIFLRSRGGGTIFVADVDPDFNLPG